MGRKGRQEGEGGGGPLLLVVGERIGRGARESVDGPKRGTPCQKEAQHGYEGAESQQGRPDTRSSFDEATVTLTVALLVAELLGREDEGVLHYLCRYRNV